MMTLGIDLGTNSIGWAVLDTSGIRDTGVLVFEEGVNREKSDSLETPATTRRMKRMARRLRFRRHLRRSVVLRILIENNMCPLTAEELRNWIKTGTFPKDNLAFLKWLKSTDKSNPYLDRARAATEKVDLLTLGRAIFHLSQRRGFKSGRKDAPDESENVSDSTPAAKEIKTIKNEITALTRELERKNLTLGQYFAEEIARGNKVRTRHTGRLQHYEKEWATIAARQGLAQPLADKIAKALFWQRPLREQSHLIGKCPLETGRKRARLGHPEFEEFRALSFINNIRVVNGAAKQPLTAAQRTAAMDCFNRKKTFEFKTIQKALAKQFQELRGVEFNYALNTTLTPSRVTAALKDFPISDTQKAFDALVFFDDEEKLCAWARNKLDLNAEQAIKFSRIRIPEGHASYSLFAIRKINRFLRQGVELSQAVFLAKLPTILPGFDAMEKDIIAKVAEHNALYLENKRTAYHDLRTENRIGVLSLESRLRSWLRENFKIDSTKFDSLYFRDPKTDAAYASIPSGIEQLPPVNLGMIRNPLVQRSMTMLRKLVNDLRRGGIIDANTRIHIELARGVNDHNRRTSIKNWQKSHEQERKSALAALQQYVEQPTQEDVLKYILAEEQDWKCLYTGNPIRINGGGTLFAGFDIEHTLPRSRSGDDSQANLTLCDSDFNRNIKKGRIPQECPDYDAIHVRLGPWREKVAKLQKKYESEKKISKRIPTDNPKAKSNARIRMLTTQLELNYWRRKMDRFEMSADDLTPSFMNRQLVDTGVMSRHAVALLKTVYPTVYPVNGAATAFARKAWGIQNQTEVKNRDSHLHHAADAIVIAALDRIRFNSICQALKTEEETKTKRTSRIPLPFPNFPQAVHQATSRVLVKHVTRHNELKQTRRRSIRLASPQGPTRISRAPSAGSTIRGQLHEETFYGKIVKPGNASTVCVKRIPVTELTVKHIDNIVDPAVRETILETIQKHEGDLRKAIVNGFQMKSGVPIKKVRIEIKPHSSLNVLKYHTATPSKHDYKNPYYVCTAQGTNMAIAVYEQPHPCPGKRKHEFIIETLIAHVKKQTIIPTENAIFRGRILPGAMAIAVKEPNETDIPIEKRFYTVNNFYGSRIIFWLHTEARSKTDLSADLKARGKVSSGSSKIDFDNPHELLTLSFSKAWESFRFEGIHFNVGFNGRIERLPQWSHIE